MEGTNWLLLAVIVLFVICMAVGFARGFLRIGISLLSVVITAVLVMYLAPIIGGFLSENTPVGNLVERSVRDAISEHAPDVSEMFPGQHVPSGANFPDEIDLINSMSPLQQNELLKKVAIPEFLRDMINRDNNPEGFAKHGVNTFMDLIVNQISRTIINILSYIIAFIIAFLLVRALMAVASFIGDLPVIGTVNKLAGILVGGGLALMIVWLFFLVVALLYPTEFGQNLFAMIEESSFLTTLFDRNLLLQHLLAKS